MISSNELNLFIRRLHRLLQDRPEIFEIKKLRIKRGYCHDDGNRIELDYRDEIISTLIHEVLHYIYPEWEEEKIAKYERWIINKLSKTQVKNIIKRFASAL